MAMARLVPIPTLVSSSDEGRIVLYAFVVRSDTPRI